MLQEWHDAGLHFKLQRWEDYGDWGWCGNRVWGGCRDQKGGGDWNRGGSRNNDWAGGWCNDWRWGRGKCLRGFMATMSSEKAFAGRPGSNSMYKSI